jgi:hypothetical protein
LLVVAEAVLVLLAAVALVACYLVTTQFYLELLIQLP